MTVGLAKTLLRLWSYIVPFQARQEWLDEWHAEVAHLVAGSVSLPHSKLIRRALLAGFDAAAVRRLSKRTETYPPQTHTKRSRGMIFSTLRDDIRYAIRTLRRNPTFTLAALVTIALGVGANTAVFSVADGIMWRSLDYPEADRLVAIWPAQWFSPREVVRLREELDSYEHFAAYSQDGQTFSDYEGNASFVVGPVVSADFFDTLGRGAALGRSFVDGEDEFGANNVVVLSHSWWREQFSADSSIIGKSIILNESRRTVVGVMPPELDLLQENAQFARPLTLTDGQPNFDGRWVQLIGRLRSDISVE